MFHARINGMLSVKGKKSWHFIEHGQKSILSLWLKPYTALTEYPRSSVVSLAFNDPNNKKHKVLPNYSTVSYLVCSPCSTRPYIQYTPYQINSFEYITCMKITGSIMPLNLISAPTSVNIILYACSCWKLKIHECNSQGQIEYSVLSENLLSIFPVTIGKLLETNLKMCGFLTVTD